MDYSVYEILALFLIYAFLGWCVEVIYHAVVKGSFINRGFDIGPLCPIYGFGALAVILFLEPLRSNWGAFYIASVLFTTLIEFLTGFLLERFFNEKWWDYSDEPFNIKGYICPRFSLIWGFACVIVVYVIHPTIMGIISIIPITLGTALLAVCYVTFAADLVVTLINVMHIRSSLHAVAEIERSLEKLSESIGTNLSDSTLAVMDTTEKIKENLDEKQTEMKDAIETAQWELSDAQIKMRSQRELADQRRHAEYAELTDRLARQTRILIRRTRRLSLAFPHLTSGKYKHIFNDLLNQLSDTDHSHKNRENGRR